MRILKRIWEFLTGSNYKWMELTELCPYCDYYFTKKDIKKHMEICGK